MTLDALQYSLGGASGVVVGFALGMFGGGGSILAVPLIVYLVGIPNAHVAIGTSAFAVAANAATGLLEHARHGVVKWRCAGVFSMAGIVGAIVGSSLGKAVDGHRLLFLFALLMLVIGVLMFRSRGEDGDPGAECTVERAPKVLGYGALTGVFSGFFGIGGGFLIVPGLIASTRMPIINAIGTSLVAVVAFGLTTALSYAVSGFVNWGLAGVLILGGLLGSQIGCLVARKTANSKGALKILFAGLITIVASYMMFKSLAGA